MNPSPLADAVTWVQSLLLGQLATMLGILAFALLGFGMLQGRIRVREALRIVIGLFVIFGAPLIAQGILSSISGQSPQVVEPPPVPAPQLPKQAPQYDPYAGVAVPDAGSSWP